LQVPQSSSEAEVLRTSLRSDSGPISPPVPPDLLGLVKDADLEGLPVLSVRPRRTRFKIAVLFLVLLVCTAGAYWLLAGGGRHYLPFGLLGAGPDEEMMRYMPSNSQVILSIRAGSVAQTEAFRELARQLPELRKLETAIEESSGLAPSEFTHLLLGGTANSEALCVCRTRNPVRASDIIANKHQSKHREEKVGNFTIYTSGIESFCVVQERLIVFGTAATIRETLLRGGPPQLSSGLEAAIRTGDFSRDVVCAVNAKDVLRKNPHLITNSVGGLSKEVADAMIDANTAVVLEISLGKAIECRATVCCKDKASANELRKLQEKSISRIRSDPMTSKPVLRSLASERWSVDGSRIIGVATIDVDTFVELVKQGHTQHVGIGP
jgi:hypothetical protein